MHTAAPGKHGVRFVYDNIHSSRNLSLALEQPESIVLIQLQFALYRPTLLLPKYHTLLPSQAVVRHDCDERHKLSLSIRRLILAAAQPHSAVRVFKGRTLRQHHRRFLALNHVPPTRRSGRAAIPANLAVPDCRNSDPQLLCRHHRHCQHLRILSSQPGCFG